jgi:hypothetical protein
MSMSNLAYSRTAYKSFSRSARHILQLIAGHQSLQTGWAYLSYLCLSDESGLTRRRVMQLVALLEEYHVLEVRRGHGRGNVNFYRILREEDGLPVPHRSTKKVKSQTPSPAEKVKFPTPPEPEKVKSEPGKGLESLPKTVNKVVNTKERKEKEPQPFSPSPENGANAPERCTISPEVMRKFGLRYSTEEWPPTRGRERDVSPAGGGCTSAPQINRSAPQSLDGKP